jgi:hypothetical protein
MPRTSSSATETDITGMSLADTPAPSSCLKNATLESPLSVLTRKSDLAPCSSRYSRPGMICWLVVAPE